MTERDRFELDLADSLRAYAEETTTQVHPTELARHFAAAYPHGRTRFGPWHLGPTMRLAWLPLLLAGLLTALVGGMLIVGSQPVQRLTAVLPTLECPPGSNPDEPGPVDQARPFGWFEPAFDRQAGKLVALAGANTPDSFFPVETWTFDVCTNTWTRMHPNQEPPAMISRLVYDVGSDTTIGVHEEDREPFPYVGNVWAYDLQTNTWTEKGQAPTDAEFCGYVPGSGLVVASGAEPWSYDVETDVWTPIDQANEPDGGLCTYDASVDRIVGYDSGNGTWLLDIRTSAWSRSGAETPVIKMGDWAVPTIVYDGAAARTVVAGDFRWGAYDATADQREILIAADPGEGLPKPMVYDPVNERLIVRDGGGIGIDGELVAFKLATDEWTVLLAPSDEQPTPSPE